MGSEVVLRSIGKSFAGREGGATSVLSGVDLTCDVGSATVIKGRSGSGKSTLLNIIAGLHLPDRGDVVIDDVTVNRLPETKRDRLRAEKIGYIFQTFNLLSPLSVLENITLPAALTGLNKDRSSVRAREILVQLGLEPHLDKRPYELSVGQRQRVAVGRAIFKAPALLLADEPTANLDSESAETVVAALKTLNEDGTTLIAATHDPRFSGAFDAVIFDVEPGENRR